MRRRDFVALLGSVAAAWPRAGVAEQGYQRFIPFLIDLPGWTGLPPAGTEEQGKGGRAITAGRSYQRGEARFSASVFSGTAALTRTFHITTGAQKSTLTINGFRVTTQSSANVIVLIAIALSLDATFSLIFNYVSEDEALEIAQKFDWKGIQALLN